MKQNNEKNKLKKYSNVLFNMVLIYMENKEKTKKMMTSAKLSRDISDFFQFSESSYDAKYMCKVSSLYQFPIEKKVGG